MAEFKKTVLNLVRGGTVFSLRQIGLLLLLKQNKTPYGRQVGVIADEMRLAKSAITRGADGLSEMGLIERGELPEDRRSCFLTLTPAGEKFVALMASGFEDAA